MSQADPSLSLAQRVDAVCDRFESDWKAGRRQPVEAYLADVAPVEQEAMRLSLLAVKQELDTQNHSVDSSLPQDGERTAGYSPCPEDAIGQSIGRFKILALLGEGAFGKVYRARDSQLDRDVAIKVPKLEAFAGQFDWQRFLREAKSAAAVQHPNICPVHEVNAEGEQPYIVMSFIPGKSLAEYLKDRAKPMLPKQAALIVRKLALALQVAHEKGIVHRDLKPANILFDPQRKDVIITDFGLAVRTTGDARQTQSGMLMGTPAYMSPEQARGEIKQVGPASDIFALGVILYELLTGRRPFQGSLGEVIGQVQHVEPPSVRSLNPELDERLDAVCRQAMAKEPQSRFASMKALAAALDAYLKDQPTATTVRPKANEADSDQSIGLAQVMAALSADRRAETEAVAEAVVRRSQPPRRIIILLTLLMLGGMTALASIIFYTRTPTATVMIHIDVDLNDKTLRFFLDGKTVGAEALQAPIELKVGTHKLVVMRGEEVVRKFTFVVSRDAGPRIELREETPQETIEKDQIPPDEARFEPLFNGKDLTGWKTYPEQSGGWSVEDGLLTGRSSSVNHLFSVASDYEDFHLRAESRANRYGNSGIYFRTSSGLAPSVFPKGYEVQILHEHRGPYEMLTGAMWRHGQSLKRLATVNSCDVKPNEWSTLEIIARGKHFVVKVDGTIVSEAEDETYQSGHIVLQAMRDGELKVDTLVQFRKIEIRRLPPTVPPHIPPTVSPTVDLERPAAIKALRLRGIVKVTADEKVSVVSGRAGNDPFDQLPSGPFTITEIDLRNDQRRTLPTDSLEPLAGLRGLKKLNLEGSEIGGNGIQPLAGLTSLESLNLVGCRLSDHDLAHLKGLINLTELNLDWNQIRGTGFIHLRGLRKLKLLTLYATSATDENLSHLFDLPELERLVVHQTQVTGKTFSQFVTWPRWKVVYLRGGPPSSKELLSHLKTNPALEEIALNMAWTDNDLAQLANNKLLRVLEIDNAKAITNRGLASLSGLTNLRRLLLKDSQVTDDGLDHLLGLKNLEHFHLPQQITHRGVAKLRAITSFRVLGWKSATDDGMVYMKEFPNLQELWLFDSAITDDGLRQLHALPKLREIGLKNTAVTTSGIQDLKTSYQGRIQVFLD